MAWLDAVMGDDMRVVSKSGSRRDVAARILVWAWGNTKAAVEIKALATTLPLEGSDVGWFEAP